jgi:preprotein translocase subunit YajC
MKRILTYLALAAMAVMTLASCSEEKKKKLILPNISGKAGEVVIVIDKGAWEGVVGTTLRDTLAADCPFLPQREPLYTLVDLAPSGFNSIFQVHRNLVLVNIDSSVTEPGVLFQKDIWAAPQCVIRVNAPDYETAAELIKANSEKIKTTLEQAERDRVEAFRSAPLKAGEKVRVKENGMVGEVQKVSAKAVVVAIGNISSKMPLDKVERITSNEFKSAVKETSRPVSTIRYDSSISERKLNFSTEMDVRGERLNDAVDKVTRYVDDAVMLGVPSVRIIHGKGTGVLRDELQKLIRTIPGVASVRDEHIQFGGTGVTIVTFE